VRVIGFGMDFFDDKNGYNRALREFNSDNKIIITSKIYLFQLIFF